MKVFAIFHYRHHLFQICWFAKIYTIARGVWLNCPVKTGLPRDKRNAHRKLTSMTCQLYELMDDMDLMWNRRWLPENDWNGVVDNTHRFMVDTFPVHLATPISHRFSKKLWNGKYGKCVAKVSLKNKPARPLLNLAGQFFQLPFRCVIFCQFMLITDNLSRPIFMSGPHYGVISDITIWRRYGPDLQVGERGVADLAYHSADTPELTYVNKYKSDFNRSHQNLSFHYQLKRQLACRVNVLYIQLPVQASPSIPWSDHEAHASPVLVQRFNRFHARW